MLSKLVMLSAALSVIFVASVAEAVKETEKSGKGLEWLGSLNPLTWFGIQNNNNNNDDQSMITSEDQPRRQRPFQQHTVGSIKIAKSSKVSILKENPYKSLQIQKISLKSKKIF
jgi:hypothetical protein